MPLREECTKTNFYFPPVYCTLRACGKFLILNALLAGIRMNFEARIMLIVTSSVFFRVVWWYTTYAHVLKLLSLLFAGFRVVHTHITIKLDYDKLTCVRRMNGTLHPVLALGLVHLNPY